MVHISLRVCAFPAVISSPPCTPGDNYDQVCAILAENAHTWLLFRPDVHAYIISKARNAPKTTHFGANRLRNPEIAPKTLDFGANDRQNRRKPRQERDLIRSVLLSWVQKDSRTQASLARLSFCSAERARFELAIPFWGTHAFQACLFSHSSISPDEKDCKYKRISQVSQKYFAKNDEKGLKGILMQRLLSRLHHY